MQYSLREIFVTGVAALLAIACRGSEGTPPQSPEAPDGTHSGSGPPNNSTGSTGGTTGSIGGATSGTPTASGGGDMPRISVQGCGKLTLDTTTVDHAAPGRIVVLGSSTAEGQRASAPEQAWVARYQTYVTQQFPNFTVENLGKGGLTTYHIQADDYAPPAGRPAPIRGNNITAALAKAPDAIIINLPTNDQYEGFSLEEQMANYERVAQLAAGDGVLVWVATTQPRDFSEAAKRQELMATRDEIQARFTPKAIDFWTDIANSDGTIQSIFNAGDGTHLNDAGHAVLAQLVTTCAIPEVIVTSGE